MRRLFSSTLCGAVLAGCTALPQPAVESVRDAGRMYAAGQYDQAAVVLDRVITEQRNAQGIGEAYYVRGLCHSRQHRYRAAEADLRWAAEHGGRAEIIGRSWAQLGHLAYDQGHYDTAAKYYASALPELPGHPPTDEVYFQHGDSLQKLGRWRDAREVLPKVWHLFPNSHLTQAARRKFAWPHDFLSIQCGAFTDRARARDLERQLRERRLDSRVEVDLRARPPLTKVFVGRFPTFQAARGALPVVRAGVDDAIIVP